MSLPPERLMRFWVRCRTSSIGRPATGYYKRQPWLRSAGAGLNAVPHMARTSIPRPGARSLSDNQRKPCAILTSRNLKARPYKGGSYPIWRRFRLETAISRLEIGDFHPVIAKLHPVIRVLYPAIGNFCPEKPRFNAGFEARTRLNRVKRAKTPCLGVGNSLLIANRFPVPASGNRTHWIAERCANPRIILDLMHAEGPSPGAA